MVLMIHHDKTPRITPFIEGEKKNNQRESIASVESVRSSAEDKMSDGAEIETQLYSTKFFTSILTSYCMDNPALKS